MAGVKWQMSCTRIGMPAISNKGNAIRRNDDPVFRLLVMFVLTMCNTMSAAQVEDGVGNASLIRADETETRQAEAVFMQECSSCHIAFPPNMLPNESWRNIMAGLDKHFGSDASLPDKENKEIAAFLADNSVESWGKEVAPQRITKTHWFMRKHNSYFVPREVLENDTVKSLVNCPACHKRADRGEFSKRDISMPE